MKKFLKISAVSVLFLLSCNRTDDTTISATQTGVLPKKITSTYSNYPNFTKTVTYTYNGNKLSEINITPQDDVSKVKFTYTGDNITKIESFAGANFSLYMTGVYEYTNDKATKYTYTPSSGNSVVTNFTYNTDGSVTESSPVAGSGTRKYTIANGNITKIESFSSNGTLQLNENYTYDSKNNIHKNITGLLKTPKLGTLVWDLAQVSTNNITAYQTNGGSITYSYDYNADSYPTKSVETRGTSVTTSLITY